ncbi:hypothetical protein CCACVL1_23086 [Corchorus capsularis]|uniref:Uncharacterized protein n=1 Tax=Corchorus capsularis TaxID=210143 RepID=A0A1R3GVE0_COCAP|nr:hypothetical protein CCACVL1_23086 [Corchorus capsularis]
MEGISDDNIFEKQRVMGTTKTKVGKPPTRLQKQAPTSLMLNQMNGGVLGAGSAAAIPLLSPLILSPKTTFQETDDFVFPSPFPTPAISAPFPTPVGWKHPASPGIEASALYSLFQAKCLVINDPK